MRLIGAVKRLEGAAATRKAEPARYGIAWTKEDARVSADELAEGEYIAVDVYMEPSTDGGVSAFWRLAERVTTDTRDLGVFYEVAERGGEAARVGLVVAIEPDMIRYRLDSEDAWGAEPREFLRPVPVDSVE